MNQRLKRAFTIIIITLIVMEGILLKTGYCLVMPLSEIGKEFKLNYKIKHRKVLSIFSKFDFSKDNWKVYIKIDPSDFNDLHPLIPKTMCITTDDRKILQQMKETWQFKIIDGDIATVTSTFYLLKNNKLVYESGIVLDKSSIALQNEEYGEMIPTNPYAIINSCKQFKKVYWPIIVF